MPGRWLRIWANLTVGGTMVLLALGTVVTSFRFGMEDQIWPTAPWHLALINWSEPSRGFLIEHAHRLAGWSMGGVMTMLAFGLWWTESVPKLRWGGLAALMGLTGAYLYLHRDLIQQTKTLAPGLPLSASITSSTLLVIGLAAVMLTSIATAYRQSPGWCLRLLAVALLIGVMIQGLLGGLRVHLDVILGKSLSVIHASFSQVVFGLAVIIAMLCQRDTNRRVASISTGAGAWSLTAIAVIYVQIVAGAVLRHTSSPFGSRLHLLLAFVGVVAIVVTCGQLWRANAARGWVVTSLAIVIGQLLLGIESWLVRFADGLSNSEFRRITEGDAILRTGHALVGYLLFALTIVLAVKVHRATANSRIETGILEAVT